MVYKVKELAILSFLAVLLVSFKGKTLGTAETQLSECNSLVPCSKTDSIRVIDHRNPEAGAALLKDAMVCDFTGKNKEGFAKLLRYNKEGAFEPISETDFAYAIRFMNEAERQVAYGYYLAINANGIIYVDLLSPSDSLCTSVFRFTDDKSDSGYRLHWHEGVWLFPPRYGQQNCLSIPDISFEKAGDDLQAFGGSATIVKAPNGKWDLQLSALKRQEDSSRRAEALVLWSTEAGGALRIAKKGSGSANGDTSLTYLRQASAPLRLFQELAGKALAFHENPKSESWRYVEATQAANLYAMAFPKQIPTGNYVCSFSSTSPVLGENLSCLVPSFLELPKALSAKANAFALDELRKVIPL